MNTKRPSDTSMNFMWNITRVALLISVDFIVKGSDDRFECRYRSQTYISSDMGVLINARREHTQSITHIPIKSGKEVDK